MGKSPRNRFSAASALVLFFFSSLAHAGNVAIKVSLSPAGSFVAKSDKLIVAGAEKGEGASLMVKEAELNLDSLETGIALRDKHMKEKYFETSRFPKAKVATAVGKNGKFVADLVIREKKKRVSGTYKFDDGNVEVQFPCRLSDFAIAPAKYLGVGVDDQVEVTVELPVKEGSRATSSTVKTK